MIRGNFSLSFESIWMQGPLYPTFFIILLIARNALLSWDVIRFDYIALGKTLKRSQSHYYQRQYSLSYISNIILDLAVTSVVS